MPKKETFEKDPASRRVQVDFTRAAEARLERLRGPDRLITRKAVLAAALNLLELLSENGEAGQVLKIEDSAGNVIFRVPVKALL